MSQYNNPYYLYTGDGGVNNATIVPDITAIPKNENFQIESSLNKVFNNKQTLFLKDNFFETFTHEEFPRNSNTSTNYAQIEFDFNLLGYVNLKDFVLSLTIPISYTESGAEFGPYYNTCEMTPFPILNILNRYELSIGQNSFIVGRPEFTNDLMAIKTYLTTKFSTERENTMRSILGSPTSQNNQEFAGEGYFINSDWRANDQFLFANNMAFVSNGINETVNRQYPIMLSDFIPFFNQRAYFPQHLRIKLKMYFQTFPTGDIRNNIIYRHDGLTLQEFCKFTDTTIIAAQSSIIYNYSILKNEAATTFNRMFQAESLLYNQYHWRTFRVTANGSSTYEIPITWSKMRPLELFFSIEKNNNALSTGFGNPTLTYNGPLMWCSGFPILRYEIYANGQRLQYYKSVLSASESGNQNFNILNAYDVLNNNTVDRMDKEYLEETQTINGKIGNNLSISPIRFILDPNMNYTSSSRSLDKGTTQLRVSMVFGNLPAATGQIALTGIPPEYDLVFRFKEPSQLSIDSSHKVEEVDWPAIRANSKTYLNKNMGSINAN